MSVDASQPDLSDNFSRPWLYCRLLESRVARTDRAMQRAADACWLCQKILGLDKHNQLQHLDHLQIEVGAVCDEDRANIEDKSLCEVDERASDAVCATFDERAERAHGGSGFEDGIKLGAEDVSEAQGAGSVCARNGLAKVVDTRRKTRVKTQIRSQCCSATSSC